MLIYALFFLRGLLCVKEALCLHPEKTHTHSCPKFILLYMDLAGWISLFGRNVAVPDSSRTQEI